MTPHCCDRPLSPRDNDTTTTIGHALPLLLMLLLFTFTDRPEDRPPGLVTVVTSMAPCVWGGGEARGCNSHVFVCLCVCLFRLCVCVLQFTNVCVDRLILLSATSCNSWTTTAT